ncbi:MAG: helix-turn-helix domain-containing protein [Thermomicrobiales bacterium]
MAEVNPGWFQMAEHGAGQPRLARWEDPEQVALAQHVGARLAEERQARGWSQADLAERLGVDRTAVGRWERGNRAVPLHRLIVAARLFALPVERLLP